MRKYSILLLLFIIQAFPVRAYIQGPVVDTISDSIPYITLLGHNPMYLEPGDTYTEPGATAYDYNDGDITDEIEITGTVNTALIGIYTVTYSVENSLGDNATMTRTVHVTDSITASDTIPPIITLLGHNPMYIRVHTPYDEPGAIAIDSVDGDLTDKIIISDTLDTGAIGEGIVCYIVSDQAGNQTMATRVVYVTDTTPVDTFPPEITLKGPDPMYIQVGNPYNEPGATAFDDVDGDISDRIIIYDSLITDVVGTGEIYYSVTDNAGNQTMIPRIVHVVDTTDPYDSIPPVISIIGANPMHLDVGDTFIDPGATAVDNLGEDITDRIQVIGEVNTLVEGLYIVQYCVSDNAGNGSTAERYVMVGDSVTIQDTVIYADTGTEIKLSLIVSNGNVESIDINPVDTMPPLNSQDIVKAYDFSVTMEDEATFHGAWIKLPVTDDDIAQFDKSTLTLRYFNESEHCWEVIPSTVDIANKVIGAKISHFSIYAITGIKNTNTTAPKNLKHQTKIVQVNRQRIIFSLNRNCPAHISLYNCSGKLIKTLFKGYGKQGKNIVTFNNGMNISRGQYYIIFKFGTKKKVLPYLAID